MIRLVSPRDSRALLIGAGCILGIMAYSRLLPWWTRTLREERDAAREIRAQLVAATARVQRMPAIKDSVHTLGQRFLLSRTQLLDAGTVAGASAELANLLAMIAAEAGVELGVVQPLGDTLRADPFVGVGVRTELTGDVRGIMDLLRSIERDTVLLAVHSLTLAQSDPAADDSRAEVLRGDMVLRALFRPSDWR